MSFFSKLFGVFNRVEAAQDRVAIAFENLAADVEALRTAFRERVGLNDLPAMLPAPEAPALPAPATNGEESGKRTTRRKTA
jgi:hypothetical protein